MMKNIKPAWQKTVYVSGFVSFVAAIACLIFLFIKVDVLGWEHPVSASLMAAAFFFVSVGVVLISIGKSNLPSFKVGKTDS